VALVESFGHSDEMLNSSVGGSAGGLEASHMARTLLAPHVAPAPYWNELIRPLLRSNL
jgi:hypothetical protein